MSNEKMLSDVLQSSILVKDCSDAGIQLELESDSNMLQNRWNFVKNTFCQMIETQNSLETRWDSYSKSFNSVSEWISSTQDFVINLHLNRLCTSEEYQNYFEELSSKNCILMTLKEEGEQLCLFSNLHPLAKKNLAISFASLSECMQALLKALKYCQEITQSMIHDKHHDWGRIKDIQSSLNNMNMALYDTVPSEKQKLEISISNTEKTLQDISQHYSDLLHMKESFILQEIPDFTLRENIALNVSRTQEMTSRLSGYYIKLIETCAKNNTFLENCMLLMQLLRKLKELHAVELPSDYTELKMYFLKSQIMEIYILAHQIILLQIINSKELTSSFKSRFGNQILHSCLCEFVKEWDSLETAYRNKMTFIKERICLWQKYLYYMCMTKSSLRTIWKEIKERTLVSNIHEMKEESLWILELQTRLSKCLNDVDLVKNAANELHETLNDPVIREDLENQVSEVKQQIKMEMEVLIDRKTELSELECVFNNITSHLRSSHEKLSSVQLYITQGIPSSFEEMKKELERTEVQKVTNTKVLEILNEMDVKGLKCDRTNARNAIEQQIVTQKNFGQVLNYGLDLHISFIHKNLDSFAQFERKYMYLMKWCKKMEQKIKKEFTEISHDSILYNLNKIEEEINNMKLDFEDIINLGNSLSHNEEIKQIISEKISLLNSASSGLMHLHAERLVTVRRIILCLGNLEKDSEKLNKFLTVSEHSIKLSSLNLKELSYEEIKKKLNNIQGVIEETTNYEDVAYNIQNLLAELESHSSDCSNICMRSTQYSQSILYRWTSFKEIIAKLRLSLHNIKTMWEEFVSTLEKVERWLISKEDIASKVNYCDPGHSRNTYLEGVGVFERLNHCFQDEVQMLHSMNSSFHSISKKEFNICNTLKNRVLAANDRWHKLYKNVVEVFETVKHILQIWDKFDELKEHLLLFLTEIDLKLTEMEATNSFLETSYANIEEDFRLHEDEKERFIATAKHLMKQSECSISIIQASVDEVENYYEELYNRLRSIKKIQIDTTEKKKSNEQHSDLIVQSGVDHEVSNDETDKQLKRVSMLDDESRSILLKHVNEKPEIDSETGDKSTDKQSYSEVAAMSPRKTDSDNSQMRKLVLETAIDATIEKENRTYAQKKIPIQSTQVKRASFDDDCTKDLLAALKEAEERMDSLEKVLSELTPSGIDEQGPNYSRLLAACRSSVDVIQHLSQFLFYDVPHDSDRSDKTDIKLQSEDLLQRWQRIEDMAMNKESRVIENKKIWENFTKELKGFETWIQKALQDYSIESCTDADIEKLVILLQRHKELVSQIRAQKKIILTLNLTGQKLLSACADGDKTASLKQRIKTVNDHWDSLYSTALLWQSKLQSEFVQSSEFRSTIDEMKLWLQESEKRIDEMSKLKEKDETILHEHHTELFALKQQLEVYCNRLETLLEITLHLFLPELHCEENPIATEENLTELQAELKSNLKLSQSLLIKCTEMLKGVSSLLGFSKFREHESQSRNGAAAISQTDSESTNRAECCSFLMRVARASFPIHAILLLLLGAAILLSMEEEEELSCRLSNNFAASLNPMLRYPDGPPPV